MLIDINNLIDENTKSIEATNNCITRLSALMNQGLDLSDAIQVNAQLSRATGDKIHLQLVRAHLNAANVIVSEMDQQTLDRLEVLSNRIDRAILADFTLNATISMIQKGLGAVEGIAGITLNHVS
jgi:uncharacterized protein YjbI with pentapeptide repeats